MKDAITIAAVGDTCLRTRDGSDPFVNVEVVCHYISDSDISAEKGASDREGLESQNRTALANIFQASYLYFTKRIRLI